jgi:hypothetical protein
MSIEISVILVVDFIVFPVVQPNGLHLAERPGPGLAIVYLRPINGGAPLRRHSLLNRLRFNYNTLIYQLDKLNISSILIGSTLRQNYSRSTKKSSRIRFNEE